MEPWIDGLWPALKGFLKHPTDERSRSDQLSADGKPNCAHREDVEGLLNGVVPKNSCDTRELSIKNNQSNSLSDTNLITSVSETNLGQTDDDTAKKDISGGSSPAKSELENQSTTPASAEKHSVNQSASHSANGQVNSAAQSTDLGKPCYSSVNGGGEGQTGNIRHSVPPLSESTLTVPLLSPEYLQIEYLKDTQVVSNLVTYLACQITI